MASVCKNNIKYIKDNIADVNDTDIDIIYNKVIGIITTKKKIKKNIKKLKRLDKILYIESNLKFIENDDLDINNYI